MVAKGEGSVGKGRIKYLGLANENCYMHSNRKTMSYCIAESTTFSIL